MAYEEILEKDQLYELLRMQENLTISYKVKSDITAVVHDVSSATLVNDLEKMLHGPTRIVHTIQQTPENYQHTIRITTDQRKIEITYTTNL